MDPSIVWAKPVCCSYVGPFRQQQHTEALLPSHSSHISSSPPPTGSGRRLHSCYYRTPPRALSVGAGGSGESRASLLPTPRSAPPCRREARKWPLCRSPTSSWRRSCSVFPPQPTSSAHQVLASPSTASSHTARSSGASANFVGGSGDFEPAIAPHPSASAARAVALAADFRFTFLPAPARAWEVQDVRDGRILLDSAVTGVAFFTEMVVCDPLHRRYLLLPPIPDDVAASVFPLEPKFACEAFFVPPGDDQEVEETSFGVIWMAHCKTKLCAFVFSSSTGQWRAIPSQCWTSLYIGLPPMTDTLFGFRQYSYGCFYWRAGCGTPRYMLLLDTRMMQYSIAESPPEVTYTSTIAIVEAGESRPVIFVLNDGESDLSYSVRQSNGGSSGQWKKEKTISLGPGHCLVCSTERYLLLYRAGSFLRDSVPGFYILDTKTFQLEKMFDMSVSFFELCAYSNYPPSLLSLLTISSGVEEQAEEMLVKGYICCKLKRTVAAIRIALTRMLEVIY